MAQTFHITPAATFASLDETRTGKVAFTITNASAKPLRAYPEIKPLGSTRREWIEVEGQAERSFSANEAQVFTVIIRPPASAGAGKYEFKLNMINADKADVDGCTEGPAVQFKVEEEAPPPPPKKWLWIALAALVVLIGSAVVVVLWPKPKMPTLETKLLADVEEELAPYKRQIEIIGKVTQDGTKAAGYIWKQEPAADTPVTPETKVVLTVEVASHVVPDFTGKTQNEVTAILVELTLLVRKVDNKVDQARVGKVVDQNPKPGTRVAGLTPVDLWIGTAAPTPPRPPTSVTIDVETMRILKAKVANDQLGKVRHFKATVK